MESLGHPSLPEYLRSDTAASLPPYEGTLPRVDRGRVYEDLASVDKAKSYLLLLSAFSQLLRDLLDTQKRCPHPPVNGDTLGHTSHSSIMCSVTGCDGLLSRDCKVGLFVEMAVRRFGIWQEKLLAKGNASLPPLDVLMVWMTYLSSPAW